MRCFIKFVLVIAGVVVGFWRGTAGVVGLAFCHVILESSFIVFTLWAKRKSLLYLIWVFSFVGYSFITIVSYSFITTAV
jgi:hypothetical protein